MSIDQETTGWNSWPTGPLRSGPMVGEVGETDAFIWAQARDTSTLTLKVSGPDQFTKLFTATPLAKDGLCLTFHVTGLAANTVYSYAIQSQHGLTPSYQFRSAPSNNARRLRIAFGSCFREPTGGKIFDAIANQQSNLFIMCGDNCYFPKEIASQDAMVRKHLDHRNCDKLRPLAANTPVLGIWDDHDFGPDNAGSEFPYKAESLSAFRLVWARRPRLGGDPGIHTSVRCGPVEIFLLDCRYFREKQTPRHILGSEQREWLKSKLLQSTAAVKLIVSSSAVLPSFVTDLPPWDGWQRDAPDEFTSLLSHIESNDIKGVLFASGDLHLGYVLRRPATDLGNGKRGPDYWEVISSPLDNNPWTQDTVTGNPVYDPSVLAEVKVRNFGMLDVDLDRSEAEIRLYLKGETGATLVERTVALSSLRVRSQPSPSMVPLIWNDKTAYFFRGERYVRYKIDPLNEGVDPGYPRAIEGAWPGLARVFPDGIDAAVVWPNGKAYFFRGNGYVRYTMDPAMEGVDSNSPRYISTGWKGLWSDGIDAAVVWPNGKAYFFKGKHYIRYTIDPANEGSDPDYPKPIKGNWKGLAEAFPDGIDGAVVWPSSGKAYFFKADQYVRYTIDPDSEGVDAGYPKLIQGNWPGLEKL